MKQKFKAVDLAYMALGAVLIAVCSWISIPMVVPFTLQTFAVFCVLGILGGKRGTISVIVYILLGAVGVPVFAGFKGGIGVLLGNTGGYIVGFIFTGLIYWLFEKLLGRKWWMMAISDIAGLIICYAFGTAWFMVAYARGGDGISLAAALGWCVIPFIIPDLVKMALAILIAYRVRRFIR